MLLKTNRRKRNHNEASWAVSYVDLLSLLLCFFVIFYDSERIKNSDPKALSALERLSLEMKNLNSGGASNVENRAPDSVEAQGSINSMLGKAATAQSNDETEAQGGAGLSPVLGELESALKADLPVEFLKHKKGLYLSFKGVSFFPSGSSKLNSDVEPVIENMLKKLEPYKGRVHITVQGHTDTQRLLMSRDKYSDNWELSALRATSVLKKFVKSGFPQETLSAEGFADTKAKDTPRELSYQRRITLIIEPIADEGQTEAGGGP